MKLWEIAQEMNHGTYGEGDAFENNEVGVLIIENGQLIYEDDGNIVSIAIGDDYDYKPII